MEISLSLFGEQAHRLLQVQVTMAKGSLTRGCSRGTTHVRVLRAERTFNAHSWPDKGTKNKKQFVPHKADFARPTFKFFNLNQSI